MQGGGQHFCAALPGIISCSTQCCWCLVERIAERRDKAPHNGVAVLQDVIAGACHWRFAIDLVHPTSRTACGQTADAGDIRTIAAIRVIDGDIGRRSRCKQCVHDRLAAVERHIYRAGAADARGFSVDACAGDAVPSRANAVILKLSIITRTSSRAVNFLKFFILIRSFLSFYPMLDSLDGAVQAARNFRKMERRIAKPTMCPSKD